MIIDNIEISMILTSIYIENKNFISIKTCSLKNMQSSIITQIAIKMIFSLNYFIKNMNNDFENINIFENFLLNISALYTYYKGEMN